MFSRVLSLLRGVLQFLLINLEDQFSRLLPARTPPSLSNPKWVTPEKGTFLITGGTCGLGKETALHLARLGYHVIITSRGGAQGAQGQAALEEIREAARKGERERAAKQGGTIPQPESNPRDPGERVELLPLNFATLASVRELANLIKSRDLRLHGLVNNAGALFPLIGFSEDGLELSLQVNHLGPFLLTHLLQENLRLADPPGRVINVSSVAAYLANVEPIGEFLREQGENPKEGSSSEERYARDKLYNILSAKSLQRFSRERGGGEILSVSLHPGGVATGIYRGLSSGMGLLQPLLPYFLTSPVRGAQTQIWLCLEDPDRLSPGGFYFNCREVSPPALSEDLAFQDALWWQSHKLLSTN